MFATCIDVQLLQRWSAFRNIHTEWFLYLCVNACCFCTSIVVWDCVDFFYNQLREKRRYISNRFAAVDQKKIIWIIKNKKRSSFQEMVVTEGGFKRGRDLDTRFFEEWQSGLKNHRSLPVRLEPSTDLPLSLSLCLSLSFCLEWVQDGCRMRTQIHNEWEETLGTVGQNNK